MRKVLGSDRGGEARPFVQKVGGRDLRVVTLEDGETIHNAFPDRDFKLP